MTTTTATTDRNGWPAELDPDTNTLTVTFPNGRRGVYETCHACKGSGAVEASWGELYHCLVCSCRGRLLKRVEEAGP